MQLAGSRADDVASHADVAAAIGREGGVTTNADEVVNTAAETREAANSVTSAADSLRNGGNSLAKKNATSVPGEDLLLPAGCFVAGTPIALADGSTKSIEAVQVGDEVLSRDEASGQTATKQVTQTFARSMNATLVLAFSNGEVIETTHEHPFYVAGRGFIPAKEVGVGTSIVTRAGPHLQVTSVIVRDKAQNVYNFEVEDFNTYFVGTSAIWVHNACADQYSEFHGSFGIDATLDENGVVEFAIEAGAKSPVRGTVMFDNMIAKFGDKITAIRGSWTYGDNLAELNKLTGEGKSLEEAAKLTWTGKRCRDKGFVNVTKEIADGEPGNYTKVLVRFAK